MKKDNVYLATITDPDQNSKPLQASKVKIEGTEIILQVDSMDITYTGILENENAMNENYKQRAFAFTLNLVKAKNDK